MPPYDPYWDNPYLSVEYKERMLALEKSQRDKLMDVGTLTLIQRLCKPAIRWFFFGACGSGRSTLLAHILIQEAIATGTDTPIFDHYQHGYNIDIQIMHTKQRIQLLKDEFYTDYIIRFRNSDMTFTMEKR